MVSDERFTNENPGEEYGYDQADRYREESGSMNTPSFRGNPPGAYQRTGYRSRMSSPQASPQGNPQGMYPGGPRGYNSRRYSMNAYPGDYDHARGYGGVRRDPYYDDLRDYYHDDYRDYYHNDYYDYYHDSYHDYDHRYRYADPYGRMPGGSYGWSPRYGSSRLRSFWRGWLDPDCVHSLVRSPRTNNFFRGVGLATVAILLAPPITRALKPLAVQAVHGVTSIVEELKGVVSEAREDIEDIFAYGKWDMEGDGAGAARQQTPEWEPPSGAR